MTITQDNRAVWITSPFGPNVLLVEHMDWREALSRGFQASLSVVSERGDLDPDKILGQDVTLSFQPESARERRYFHGYVSDFTQIGYVRRLHQYRVTVRPWLWFLTQTSDCRIFQQMSIPQIFEEIVKQYDFNDFELRLNDADHKKWENCVQYRETDFNFVSRLLEQEGISYWFRHEDGRHVMVLVDDSTSKAEQIPGYESVPYLPPTASEAQRVRDNLSSWTVSRSVVPGAVATTDYDFKEPRKALGANANIALSHARSEFELFDYPAESPVFEASASERVAKVRLEEQQTAHFTANGTGDAAGLAVGSRFALTQHPREDFNVEYLITAAHYAVTSATHDAGADEAAEEFSISVDAINSKVPFRPARVTPKPVVQGAQTALIVGRAGEEIDTDEYGRVRVQFPWDRYGQRDEKSSCWVRVAQPWAGKNWGAIHIPRIGQEVLVSFLEGDPDRPIVTGRVYNGDSMPPYDLPANATQSGIKSRSSKGGSTENFNEIRFEDKKGDEQLYVHAEKDLQAMVENDQKVNIGHDETIEIGNDRSTEVGKNETLKVGTDQKTDVGKRYVLEAGDEISIKTGASTLVMKKDGTIELKGVKLKIEGSQSIAGKAGNEIKLDAMQIKAKADVQAQLKGTQTVVEGTIVDVKADAVLSLKGSLTKIG